MILVVGINPSVKMGKSKTLARLFYWMQEIGVDVFSFTNVVHTTGVYKKADIDYNWIQEACKGYDKIFTLGEFASSALARINIPHHALPHPSPLNRNLNSKDYEREQIESARNYIHGNDRIL